MGEVSGGGMAAVIGLEPARIEAVLAASDAGRRLDVANFNSFDQTVIAGPKDDLAAVKADFEAAGVRAYIPLNVSAPFHSRYMREPQAEFAAFLEGVRVPRARDSRHRQRHRAALRRERRARARSAARSATPSAGSIRCSTCSIRA